MELYFVNQRNNTYGGFIMKKALFSILLIVVLLVCSVPTMAQDNVLHTYVDRVFR